MFYILSLFMGLLLLKILFECFDLSLAQCSIRLSYQSRLKGDMQTPYIQAFRSYISKQVNIVLPETHAALFLGLTLGMDNIKSLDTFNDMLKKTGTIHVVVVSGFNITLIYKFITKLLGSKYSRFSLYIGILFTLLYAVITGFEPPVIRAWLMGTLSYLSIYFGYSPDIKRVLLMSAFVILIFNLSYIFNMSFLLSFLATLGLVLFGELVVKWFSTYIFKSSFFIVTDFCSSISAQLLVWPLLSYKMGSISLISPFVNALVLWIIPLSTVIGLIGIGLSFINLYLFFILLKLLYPLLTLFIWIVSLFSDLDIGIYAYAISLNTLIIYYILLAVSYWVYYSCILESRS